MKELDKRTLHLWFGIRLPFFVNDGWMGPEFPDGSSGVVCTNYARAVMTCFPARTKILGWDEGKNSEADINRFICGEGHEFALVDGRWLIDPWLFHVWKEKNYILDMTDDEDKDEIVKRYGDPSAWVEIALEPMRGLRCE